MYSDVEGVRYTWYFNQVDFSGHFNRFRDMMNKKRCVVHANCQGEPLIERLMACPQFAEEYVCTLFTNYTREPVTDEALQDCSLFLYQYLGPKWGDIASASLLAKLPDSARSLCIPNMFFTGYWPTWSGEPGFNYRCTHLDEIIGLGLPPEETAILYLRADVERKFDLLDLVSKTIEHERERQKRTPIQYLDVIIEHYRDVRLFNTVNHPGSLLMNHAACEILKHLDFEPPDEAALKLFGEPFPEFEQPINPRIAQFFGWDFATNDTQYEVYGRKLTFARYVANYIMAQQAGVSDFIGYLQGEYIET